MESEKGKFICVCFDGILLPDVSIDANMLFGLKYVFDDVFIIPISFNNDYSKKNIEFVDQFTAEGPYGFIGDGVNVSVKKGDIVLDIGAWIGDFSALAAANGAKVYAFEPTKITYEWLCKTVKLGNGEIIPICKALGSENKITDFAVNDDNGGSNTLYVDNQVDINKIEMITIDQFVLNNKLERVDFIKADIEGYERYMLMGATNTLKRFAPKLAICTYHLKDDPIVLENIIKQANPLYKIVHTRHKLFASVNI